MFKNDTSTIKQIWVAAFQDPNKRYKILWGSVLTAITLACMPMFFNHIEKREGAVLNDWVLSRIAPHDMSYPIFAVIWGMGALIFYRALYDPDIFIRYIWTLILITFTRFLTISFIALDPPHGLVPLIDPITAIFYGNKTITKDLFYSGHTSTMVLILLCLRKRNDKIIGFISAIIVVSLLLVQHIHYTVDVVAAPFFVYGLYRLTGYFLKKSLL